MIERACEMVAAMANPDPYADPYIEVPTPVAWGPTQLRRTRLERAGYVVHLVVAGAARRALRVQLPDGAMPDRAAVLALLAEITPDG